MGTPRYTRDWSKNTREWIKAWGCKLLQVEGSVDKDRAVRYSIARYREERRVFEVYAFFETEGEYDTGKVRRIVGPELKRLFKADRYICVVDRCRKRKREKDKMHFEFYARCPLPDPGDVARINEIIKAAVQESI